MSNPSLPLLFTLEKAVYLKINVIFQKPLGTKMEFPKRGQTPAGIPSHHSSPPFFFNETGQEFKQ